jgi:(p)ppGpp synthase/HD superfamily hydrolase
MNLSNNELLTSEPVLRAAFFAAGAHKSIGHTRKYTGDDYFEYHVMRVAHLVADTEDPKTDTLIGAYLHDVLEDTMVTLHDIRMYFGPAIAGLVNILSYPPDKWGLTRIEAAKEQAERIAASVASKEIATIKCADILDNISDIVEVYWNHDSKFAKAYLREKETMLEILTMADSRLRDRCLDTLAIAKLELEGYSHEEAAKKYYTMREWKQYKRNSIAEMRPYVPGEILPANVSISSADLSNGSPKPGDMIARNPQNHSDQWLVSASYFEANFETQNEETKQ